MRVNFAAAVRAIARVMDRQEDVLVLFLTSHGSTDGIALRLPGLVSNGLAPEDVAAVLDREGIRNRIVVVSACYSGVFVKPLANDNTIVLTAADDKSTSFGCSSEREWTYFGDAFFNQHLKPDVTSGGGVPQRKGHHRAVGGARRFDAVKSARALRAGAGREARAAWRAAPGPRRAALMSRNHPA